MQIRLGQTKQSINDMVDWMVDEHEQLNMMDTKLDGLESMLKDIQEKLDK
jgi:archaellum component FlaC